MLFISIYFALQKKFCSRNKRKSLLQTNYNLLITRLQQTFVNYMSFRDLQRQELSAFLFITDAPFPFARDINYTFTYSSLMADITI